MFSNLTAQRGGVVESLDEPLWFAWLPSGGAEGNRTPVRKCFSGTFSGRRRLCCAYARFPFPVQAVTHDGSGSFMIHGALKALRTHGRC